MATLTCPAAWALSSSSVIAALNARNYAARPCGSGLSAPTNTVSTVATLIRVLLVPAGDGHPDREHHERESRRESKGRGLVGEPGSGCQDTHGDEADPRDRRDPTEPAPSAAPHGEAE